MTILHDEMVTGVLSVEIAPLVTAGDVEGILAALTRKDISVYGKVSSHDIKQYFSLIGLRLPIINSTSPTCKEVTQALIDFDTFDLSIPMILVKFTAILDGLVADTIIPTFTETDKATILGMANVVISRIDQLGIKISEYDIKKEIWNDDGTRRLN